VLLSDLEQNTRHVKDILQQLKAEFLKQSRQEKIEHIIEMKKQNEQYLIQNKHQIAEFVEKIIEKTKHELEKSIEQMSDINKQSKNQNQNLITQNKKQLADIFTQKRQQDKEFLQQFFDNANKQFIKFHEQISNQNKLDNAKLLEQFSEKVKLQISEVMGQISEKNTQQNSLIIKQNIQRIKQIPEQNTKFAVYLKLAEFREDLITIKTSINKLEKLSKTNSEILCNYSLKYQTKNPKATIFHLGRKFNIQILLPNFFKSMFKNLTNLNTELEVDFSEKIKSTIRTSQWLFKNFNKMENKQNKIIKDKLDSDINTIDQLLIEFIQ